MEQGGMNGKLWSKERDAQLVKMREEGFSASQIATKLGVTRNAVIGRADRLRLDGPPKSVRPKFVQKQKLLTQVKPVTWGAALTNLTAQAKAILDLEPHHCRWPIQDAPYAFCGGTKQDGSSYCPYHRGVSRRGVTAAP
jgi:GcrA cell cycle regulator